MEFINSLVNPPLNVFHKTYFCKTYNHEIGYNIYLPPSYENSCEEYPVLYHFHGAGGSESSDIYMLEKVYQNLETIVVFPNNSPIIEDIENLPVESMIISELIPFIDENYRTKKDREHRYVSGFSLGGVMSFYYAMKYPEIFSSVTAYSGSYHHYYYSYHTHEFTVGVEREKASEILYDMIREKRYLEENNILGLLNKNAEKIRNNMQISLHVGTEDFLACDSEILHLYLERIGIEHEYLVFEGQGHELSGIL